MSPSSASANARERILGRLRQRRGGPLTAPACDFSMLTGDNSSGVERLDRFQTMIESVHGEVHRCQGSNWLDTLADVLRQRGINNLLTPRAHAIGRAIRDSGREDLPPLLAYDRPIEGWRESLFHDVEASITSTRGAIAETGSLILWPDADEPRLMSLVPPVHIAVLERKRIHATFHDTITADSWRAGMPTNALLVSGPSKTADIEQTLAYGVHGPRELIVLVLE